jgi:hypothetical protein
MFCRGYRRPIDELPDVTNNKLNKKQKMFFPKPVNKKLNAQLTRCRISLLEYLILSVLYSCSSMNSRSLRRWVLGDILERQLQRRCDIKHFSESVTRLRRRGLLLTANAQTIVAIQILVNASGISPELVRLPREGNIDLTNAGASLMIFIRANVFGESATEPDGAVVAVNHEGVGYVYSNLRSECEAYAERDDSVELLGPVTACGPWGDRWWRVFAQGYKRRVKLKTE